MWNTHVFKVLRDLCGGLIQVNKNTLELNFLSHARLKVKGMKNGFIKEFIDLPCNGRWIRLKFFKLSDHPTFPDHFFDWKPDSHPRRRYATAKGPVSRVQSVAAANLRGPKSGEICLGRASSAKSFKKWIRKDTKEKFVPDKLTLSDSVERVPAVLQTIAASLGSGGKEASAERLQSLEQDIMSVKKSFYSVFGFPGVGPLFLSGPKHVKQPCANLKSTSKS